MHLGIPRAGARIGALLLPLLCLIGCGTVVTLEPRPPDATSSFRLRGRIDYAGNREYLPATVIDAGPGAAESIPVIVFRTDVRYRTSSALQILNPLLLFGFRGVGADVTAIGRLDVKRGSEVLKRYEATCVVKMRRSVWIWGAPSQSELRKQGLIAVRRMIEAQMTRDAEVLDDLVTAMVRRAG